MRHEERPSDVPPPGEATGAPARAPVRSTGAATARAFDPSSRARLTRHDLGRFTGPTLFDAVGRALCEAGCLPRKELFETWEVARRIRRRFRGRPVLDLACGHGLLAHLLLLLDDTSSHAIGVDTHLPPSAAAIAERLTSAWPRLSGRIELREAPIAAATIPPGALVASVHACGALTDEVLTRGMAAGAHLAVLPCCHDSKTGDDGGLTGWMDPALAMDATRVARLRAGGYAVRTERISRAITEKNRLLLASPPA